MYNLLKVLLLLCFVFSVKGQTNRALIIAISDYPITNGWQETHGVNDCELMVALLQTKGYKRSDITTLLNEQATKSNIVKALRRLADHSQPNDFVYIHFSGHGQQMADDNGDEPDALDESFIPYDAFYRYVPGIYEGENHLRDEELEELIDPIRFKIGNQGNVTVVLDACHSGTGTRIIEEHDYVRGTSYIFAPPGFEPKEVSLETCRMDFHRADNLSPITVFSACQPDELNYEYKSGIPAVYYGSLTFFFCETMGEMQQDESNESFYFRLKDKMINYFNKRSKSQTPYFESTDKEQLFRINKYFVP